MAEQRQILFACPEGGNVVITFPPDPLTPDTIGMVEELCAIWFRGLHRRAIERDQQTAAAVEYASWTTGNAGVSDQLQDTFSQHTPLYLSNTEG